MPDPYHAPSRHIAPPSPTSAFARVSFTHVSSLSFCRHAVASSLSTAPDLTSASIVLRTWCASSNRVPMRAPVIGLVGSPSFARNQLSIAPRSYMCPSSAVTGSVGRACAMGQTKLAAAAEIASTHLASFVGFASSSFTGAGARAVSLSSRTVSGSSGAMSALAAGAIVPRSSSRDGISSLSSESLLSVHRAWLGGAASDEESLSASDEESVGNSKSVAAGSSSWSAIIAL
mmetsp:Transcript_17271/g.49314  ORF Transcript_17271/g.49314 Transcript_17271/m.49314 type:complete len:231 (-) Transcript_17271:186-878(-)